MIHRLRLKFVCINMTIVTIMLCVIFGLVLGFTGLSMEQRSLDMMQTAALEPYRPGTPGSGHVHQPYFSLRLGPGGEVLITGSEYFDLTDRELLETLAELSSGESTGVLKEYGLRYLRLSGPTGQYVVFTDISGEISTMQSLLRSCLCIGGVSFVVFLLLSILLARWAVKPVAVAWEEQRRFVADASHELKTPLTVILSNAQMLSGNVEDPAVRERLTDNIMTVSEQMKDLVAKLLDSARVDQGAESMTFAELDWSDTVSNALLPFDCVFYERGLTLTSELEEGICLSGSAAHLTRVVDILLDNAQKYSAPGGQTRVSLRRQGRKSCLLCVANEGEPLSERELKQIFKRFYRVDAARERTGSYGLGLSIAEGIVKAHKGKIWAESRGGVNTFFVQLPVNTKRIS